LSKCTAILLSVALLLLGIYCFWTSEQYENLAQMVEKVFSPAEAGCTAVTVVYYTNFGKSMQLITVSVPYKKYESYHTMVHPYWGELNLSSARKYITQNETIINQIVEKIRNQTRSEEELADALLDFVQDKGIALSIRYYPTIQLKYPIETLVEMGGDCDTHSFLYATLMKAAGFKVLLLLSKNPVGDLPHVATAVHLTNPPTHSLPEYEDKFFTYDGEKYYFAETTTWNYRVGDLPPWLKSVDFYIIPI
jgi:hypothetical protein